MPFGAARLAFATTACRAEGGFPRDRWALAPQPDVPGCALVEGNRPPRRKGAKLWPLRADAQDMTTSDDKSQCAIYSDPNKAPVMTAIGPARPPTATQNGPMLDDGDVELQLLNSGETFILAGRVLSSVLRDLHDVCLSLGAGTSDAGLFHVRHTGGKGFPI